MALLNRHMHKTPPKSFIRALDCYMLYIFHILDVNNFQSIFNRLTLLIIRPLITSYCHMIEWNKHGENTVPAAHFSLVRTAWFWLSLSPRCCEKKATNKQNILHLLLAHYPSIIYNICAALTNLCYLWSGFSLADVAKYMRPVLEVNANLYGKSHESRKQIHWTSIISIWGFKY